MYGKYSCLHGMRDDLPGYSLFYSLGTTTEDYTEEVEETPPEIR